MTFRQLTTLSLIIASCAVSARARTIQGRVFNASDSTQLAGVECRIIAEGQIVIKTSTKGDGV
ncbi:MAG: hypothetical protein K2L11_06725, partial [Muribaculaceae bacterium]|nr:hypothetical protein [Muribaculaceae bacterium]